MTVQWSFPVSISKVNRIRLQLREPTRRSCNRIVVLANKNSQTTQRRQTIHELEPSFLRIMLKDIKTNSLGTKIIWEGSLVYVCTRTILAHIRCVLNYQEEILTGNNQILPAIGI
ncbi:hypothetical protein CASFOL_026379 [Castilleja foliolosa]|uniref:Uncharacterized protein n=1 Tax=Castilleja foliolosa TaxID=1961234 RepID=A0ABD3CHV9_9LAMI